jgi:transcriptional regulator with XRE-family HTH domain
MQSFDCLVNTKRHRMCTFGERLRSERNRLLLTQDQMAEKAGVTKQTQGLYERDKRSPNAEYLLALAGLGLDVLYVVTGQRTPLPAELDSKASALLDNYQHMSPEDQAALSRLADSLAQPEKKIKDRTA